VVGRVYVCVVLDWRQECTVLRVTAEGSALQRRALRDVVLCCCQLYLALDQILCSSVVAVSRLRAGYPKGRVSISGAGCNC
jgi:hypothetical protein